MLCSAWVATHSAIDLIPPQKYTQTAGFPGNYRGNRQAALRDDAESGSGRSMAHVAGVTAMFTLAVGRAPFHRAVNATDAPHWPPPVFGR